MFNYTTNSMGSMMISLMIFVVVSLTIVTAAVLLVVDSTVSTSTVQIGDTAIVIAESGIENALLRLLRDPSYTGEVLPVGSGQATITVNGMPGTIRSVGTIGSFERIVEADVSRVNGVLTVTNWQEVE